jgi:hypothetical protein
MAQVMNKLLPEGSIVGSWNAGVYGYFFEKGKVVGLDGLVNNPAYRHIQNHALKEYCIEIDIEYLVDPIGPLRSPQLFWDGGKRPVAESFRVLHGIYGQKEKDSIVIARREHSRSDLAPDSQQPRDSVTMEIGKLHRPYLQ